MIEESIPDDMCDPVWLHFKPEEKIVIVCERTKSMLLDKNKRYGNSSLSGKTHFGLPKGTAIKARIDDKLNRLSTLDETKFPDAYKDTIRDLTGYLILFQIYLEDKENEEIK